MLRTIIEIAVSAFAVLGIYFSITALLRRWAVKSCVRHDIEAIGGKIPGKLLLRTDGCDLDIELRVCSALIESGAFSGVVIDGGENVEIISREVDRMRRYRRGTVEYLKNEGR